MGEGGGDYGDGSVGRKDTVGRVIRVAMYVWSVQCC